MTNSLTTCCRLLGLCLVATLALLPAVSQAQTAFQAGTLSVVRVGPSVPAGTLASGTGYATFIDEVNASTGVVVRSLALPTAASGGNQPFVISGSASSEGALQLSQNGQYLALAGYAAVPGTASVNGTTLAAGRVLARIDGAGNVTTGTVGTATSTYTNNNIRSVAINDAGTQFWTGGNGATGNFGVRTLPYASTGTAVASTDVTTSPASNIRTVAVFGGQLYYGTQTVVYSVGTGLPTTAGNTGTVLFTPGGSAYAFVLFDTDATAGPDLAYVADDAAGIKKFALVGGTWAQQGSSFPLTTGIFARGLTASRSGGSVTLYATTTATPSTLVRLIDTAVPAAAPAFGTSLTTLYTTATNTVLRGVAFSPASPFTPSLSVAQGATSLPNGGATPYSFGNQNLSTTSSAVAFTLTNTGAGAITINSISYGGTNGSNFASSGTAPTSIANGGTATLNTTFAPSATGSRTGTVTINYTNPTGTSSYTYNLSGTGTNAANPLIAVTQGATSYPNGGATPYGFGSQPQGSTSAPVTFTITNASPGDALTITGISTTGNFALSGAAPTTVAANNGTATFQLTFSPTAQGAMSGTVSIANDSQTNNPYVVNLSGTGSTAITATSANANALLAGVRSTLLIQGSGFVTGAAVNTVTYSNGTVHSVANVSATILRVDVTPTGAGNLQVSNTNGTSGMFALTTATPPVADLFEPFELYAVNGALNTSNYATTRTDFMENSGTVSLFGTLLSNADLATITAGSERRNNSQSARVRAGGYIEFARPSGVGTLNLLACFYGTDNGLNPLTTFTVTYSTDGGMTFSSPVAGAPAAGSLPVSPLTAYSFVINQPGAVQVRISNTIAYAGTNVARINVDDVRMSNFALGDLTVTTPGQSIAGQYNNVTIANGGSATLSGPLTVNTGLTVQSGGTLNTGCQPLTGAGSFTLASGGTLGICDVAGLTSSGSTGAVQVTGSRSYSAGATYVYNGSQAQSTGAGLPGTVRNLTVNNAAGLSLSQPLAVAQVLALANGNLNTATNAFTLLSVAGQGTALIDNTGGTVVGTGTMQRAVDILTPDNIGYHHFSSPVAATTINDLASPGFDLVLNPAYNAAPLAGQVRPFPTVFGYDERRITPANGFTGTAASSSATDLGAFDKGFFSPTSGDAMTVGRGYTASFPNALTTNFTGTFNTGAVTISNLTRGTDANAGYQLLGNPYPSPLNAAGFAAAATNLNTAVYVFHATSRYGGAYSTYLSTLVVAAGNSTARSSDAPSSIIPAGTGFFMQVTAPNSSTGALALTNANRVTTFNAAAQPAFGRQTTALPTLALALTGAGLTDHATVYFTASATAGVDAAYDAAKLPNTNGLNLATVRGAQQLAIDGRPVPTTATVLPLFVGVPATGTYTLRSTQLSGFGSMTVYLRDALTGTRTLLTGSSSYRFAMSGYNAPGRFALEFAPAGSALATAAQVLSAAVVVYPNPAAGRFQVSLPANTKVASATLSNALGQVVLSRSFGASEGEFVVATPGVYTLRLTVDGNAMTRKVVVE